MTIPAATIANANKRPAGSNADEWVLFIAEHSEATEFLAVQIAEAIEAAVARERAQLRDTLEDVLAGWRYLRTIYGDLYGVGWDRVENKVRSALKEDR